MNYLWLTLKHKWFVFLAGLRTKAPLWRLLIHDWSKLTPSEYFGYQRQFFEERKSPAQWAETWLRHQNRNPHHWEFWVTRTARGAGRALPMPEWAVREMVADWMAASRAYEGEWPQKGSWRWLNDNFAEIRLHPDSRRMTERVLAGAGLW